MNSPETEGALRRRKIIEAFGIVLDMDSAQREAYLSDTFGDDAEAIARVHALVTADEMAPSAMPTELPGGEGERPILVAPSRIGPYRLDGMIGSGGMGEVWLGVRDDGLFDQMVAIKLMRPSRFASESLAFFDTERRALARLNHRHIARLFDGGVTESGLPWFIMELIDGQPLHVFAAGRKPDVSATLHLATEITQAAQYAHAQLVVHADLKPSNILITGDGEPCLVDFGIASLAATAAEQADKAAFPSTPAYASPQRLRGDAPTPSDDIFSLGLILHGLLTGDWPEKPVTGPLKTTGDTVCDAVIAKACAAEPDDRYATAQALGDDLRAIMSHHPISTQMGDWRIMSRLFVRRHPRAVAAGAAGLAGTVAALALITGLYVQASHERHLADARFNDVRSLANYMLTDFHDDLLKLPGSTALREKNAQVGWTYLAHLSEDQDVSDEVRREIAVGYGRLGNAQATSSGNGIGDVKAGDEALLKSENGLRDLIRKYPGRDDYRRDLARTLTWRSGVVFGAQGDAKAATAMVQEAFALYDDILKRHPDDLESAYGRWNSILALGDFYHHQNDWPRLKTLMQGALDRFKATPVTPKYASLRALLEAGTENTLGDATYYIDGPMPGVAHYVRAEALMQSARDAGLMDVRLAQRQAYYDDQLSSSYEDIGQPKLQLQWALKGQSVIDGLVPYDDSADTLHTRDLMALEAGSALISLGRKDEGVAEVEAIVGDRKAYYARHPDNAENHLRVAWSLHRLSQTYSQAGMTAKACAASQESLRVYDDVQKLGALGPTSQALDIAPQKEFVATCPK